MGKRSDIKYMRDPHGDIHPVNDHVVSQYVAKGWKIIPTPIREPSPPPVKVAPVAPALVKAPVKKVKKTTRKAKSRKAKK